MYLLSSFKDSIKKFVPESILFKISPFAIRVYTKGFTWYTCGRKFSAPIDPFELIYINPETTSVIINSDGRAYFSYSNAISEVVNGEWDHCVNAIEKTSYYQAFKKRFIEGGNWEDTRFYSRVCGDINSGETKWGCSTIPDFHERLKALDELYLSIKNKGYHSQYKLRVEHNDKTALRDIHNYWPPELHEVTVNIGRDGSFILHDGRHRLIIAQLLGINDIPVRVKTRHEEWQTKRDRTKTSNVVPSGISPNHPDLQNIVS